MILGADMMNCLKCFLGGSTPDGFRTYFGRMIADTDFHTYIIKGGPGTGKSSLMKRLAEAFPDDSKEIYYCSSDPDSLDAVVFTDRKVILVDGTAPHVFEPEYPGAVQQILDLGAYWDISRLKEAKNDIIAANSAYLQHHARCRRYITALAAVAGDTFQIGASALNEEKLEGFVERFSKKTLPKKPVPCTGKTVFRQLSAITPKGLLTFIPEDHSVYLLNDSFYAGSDRFLRRFAEAAVKKGYDVSISVCGSYGNESFEHMLIPELKVAFLTADPINELSVVSKQPINFRRFYDKSIISEKKLRLKFNAAAVKDLCGEAVVSLKNAKAEHDALERLYIPAVDFDGVNRLCYSLISKIKSLSAV